jgi:methylated-DNA-[protein]-cysteine S-methyltransferase
VKHLWFYDTSLGRIAIAEENGKVTNLILPGDFVPPEMRMEETETLKKAAGQLMEYLQGKRTVFDMPLAPEGTAFQKQVWEALLKIPYGETSTYGKLAREICKPGAARAVGMANNRNPIPVIIPCHRVIGADGSLTGYGGGLPMKEKLLALEKGKAMA